MTFTDDYQNKDWNYFYIDCSIVNHTTENF